MKAIVVIDMLEDFFKSGLLAEIRNELTKEIMRLVKRARRNGCPIIWVRQEFRSDLEDAFMMMRKSGTRVTIAGTDGCKILAEFEILDEDYEIVKKRYSAFYGTGLDDLLARLKIDEIVLSGVNTHACVRTTAVDAYQRDIEVSIPRECVASWDREHHEVTLKYFERAIARVERLDEIFPEVD